MFTPGYITLQEAIEATPMSYLANRTLLPNILQILLLFLTVLFDPYILFIYPMFLGIRVKINK